MNTKIIMELMNITIIITIITIKTNIKILTIMLSIFRAITTIIIAILAQMLHFSQKDNHHQWDHKTIKLMNHNLINLIKKEEIS